MQAPDKHSLLWTITHYRETLKELIHSRRNGGSKIEQKRLVAKLSRLRRHFSHDGKYHFTDTLYRAVFSEIRTQRRRNKRKKR